MNYKHRPGDTGPMGLNQSVDIKTKQIGQNGLCLVIYSMYGGKEHQCVIGGASYPKGGVRNTFMKIFSNFY